MNSIPKIAVFGGGSWATAIVKMLCENNTKIGWYMRNKNTLSHIKTHKHNPNYLSSVDIDTKKLVLSNDINEMVAFADYLIFVIPSAFLEEALENLNVSLKDKIIFSAIKGIIPSTDLIIGEHFNIHYNIPFKDIGVITGPCHAEEVALERLSYLTIACRDPAKAEFIGANLACEYIKVKISDDIIGTEYAAMLKNIFAIAAGMAHGLRYGDNFQSVLMSNAIREMKRFIKKVHHMKRNINNSAYLGDLLVTGYSIFSRNRLFGTMIGKGYTVKSAMMEMSMVVEGYYAAKSAYLINQKNGAVTPIIDTVYRILYQGEDTRIAFKKLTHLLD